MKSHGQNVQSPEEVSAEVWKLACAEWRKRNEALKKIGTTARETGLTVEAIATEIRNHGASILIPLPSWTPDNIREGLHEQRHTQYDSPALKPEQERGRAVTW